jgi:hypothetical protein
VNRWTSSPWPSFSAEARERHAARTPRGERNPRAKLSVTDVRDIRALRSLGYSHAEIGREYGVTRQCAYRVVRRLTWAHVA